MIHQIKKHKTISFLSLIIIFSFLASALGEQVSTSTTNSQGTIIYPPSSTQFGSARGELYLWLGFWMSPGDSTSQRIVNARQSSGIPIWIDTTNYGSPQITSSFINYFHAYGVKVVARLWSNGGNTPLNTILHDTNVNNQKGGSVDYQLSIGPEIDAFMIDEAGTSSDYQFDYYKTIIDYVHSKGKLCFLNVGSQRMKEPIVTLADKISVEFCWWGFINNYGIIGNEAIPTNLIAKYPQKFIGVSNDWGYNYRVVHSPTYNNIIAPPTASGDRPALKSSGGSYGPTINLDRAVWDVKTGWAGGVYSMQAQPDQYGALPSWWEQYVAGLRS